MSKPEKHEFQAEIAQLLEIVIHSLYTEKEIFIRELISNAADANEKLQFLQQTAGNDIFEPERPLVADTVTVYTRSYRPDAQGWKWTSDGKTGYEIEPAEDLERGTKIVLHLRDTEYSEGYKVESIIKRYSNFVSFSIELNGNPVNTIQPLWTKNRSEISDEDYTEFYKYIGHDTEAPEYRLHFNADAPLSIKAILFVPERSTELITMSRQEGEVHLYCKRVLITAKAKGLFPDWLRFLKGVVDSEDLPLNISRETMQDSALLRKINEVLTKRVLKWLDEEAQSDAVKYAKFFAQHGHCLKEGVAMDWAHREAIAKLLRFKSSLTEGESLTSLAEYIARMPEGQKEIYFLHAPDREAAEASPDFEVFRAKNWEVLFLEDPRDEFVLEHLHTFDGKNLVATGKADITLERPVDRSKSLTEEQVKELAEFLKKAFAERVSDVRSSQRLVGSPAAVREPEGAMNASMRRMMKMMGQEAPEMAAPKPDFEINPDHPVIVGVERLRHKDEALATQVAAQLLDNAMVAAGLIEDPRAVLGRLNLLLEKLLPSVG